MNRTFILLALLLSSTLQTASRAAEVPSPVGRQVADFTLQDFRGAKHSLADLQDKQLVVLAFLGTECPLAKLYTPRLVELAKEYEGRGVAVLGICSNQQDSITELAAFARTNNVSFPLLKDAGNGVADACGAQRTPEVIVLDAKRTVRYAGRIDDRYVPGVQRNKSESDDLEQALDELLAGKEVSRPRTQATGCLIGRAREAKSNAPVTYSNQVARILQERCVECHRSGEIAPFSLTNYEEAVGWAEMIEEVVRENRMPPWHADPKHGQFANDRRLSDEEKRLLRQWAVDGAPQGNPADLPKPREYVTGWQLPREPDQVIYMADKPFDVPAEGEVRYQHFTVDPGFTEDKWVSAAQVLPGNRSVVHHIIVFLQTPGSVPGQAGRQHFVAYVPGNIAKPFDSGMAKKIPAGTKLVFQVHYTPVGTPQTDRSQVAFIYANPNEIKQEAVTNVAGDAGFEIPPFAPKHKVEATSRAYSKDVTLLSLSPHMHFRGSAFRYDAVFPDGKKETLLDVPHYDFNWQTTYVFKEPKLLPAGTKLHCVAYFDNSPENLANPNPAAKVRWGDQTWEEMMLGYYEIAFSGDPPPGVYDNRAGGVSGGDSLVLRRMAEADPKEVLGRLDADKNGTISREEFPALMRPFYDRLDADKSGSIDVEELGKGLKLLAKPK